jgi:hypothetical protein
LISPIASRTIGGTGETVSADNTIMKRVIAIAVVFITGSASLAWAQTPTSKPIAEVAKAEEARRKSVKKPAKVYTNGSLTADISKGEAPPPSAAPTASADKPANASPAKPGETAKPAEDPKQQEYWVNRINTARAQMQRTQMFAESLQSRINALLTDFVNRDDPAQRAKIEGERKAALAELEKLKKELDEQNKAIAAIQEEARRAGVPAGWLRPGA